MDIAWHWLIAVIVVSLLFVCGALLIHWFCNRRNFRRFVFGIACFITLIALFYAEENWRGKHAWNKFKREHEAKGEKLDMASITPPPVPDDQNFAMTPIVSGSYNFILTRDGKFIPPERRDTNLVNRMQMAVELYGHGLGFTNSSGGWETSKRVDLEAWQKYYRWLADKTNFFPVSSSAQSAAHDVLTALSRYDSTVEEIHTASKLPFARYPLEYDKDDPAAILLPHLGSQKPCVRVLQMRAIAELQSGQTEKALDDIKLTLRLIESVRSEPIVISHLVRIAMFNIVVQPIWEGLAERRWSDSQLASLDAELSKLDFLSDYQLSICGEQAFGVGIIDYLCHNRTDVGTLFGMTFDGDGKGSSSGNRNFQIAMFHLAPGGWFDQNKISICRAYNKYFLPAINLETRTEVRTSKDIWKVLENRNPYNWFVGFLLSALEKLPEKYVRAQSSTDTARIAIALERHRLAHGNFPESLDALAPQFMAKIPHDVIGGKPLHYRRTDDGQFILYSIGWNETDDGGVVGHKEKSETLDPKQGDWVWRYPAN